MPNKEEANTIFKVIGMSRPQTHDLQIEPPSAEYRWKYLCFPELQLLVYSFL